MERRKRDIKDQVAFGEGRREGKVYHDEHEEGAFGGVENYSCNSKNSW